MFWWEQSQIQFYILIVVIYSKQIAWYTELNNYSSKLSLPKSKI